LRTFGILLFLVKGNDALNVRLFDARNQLRVVGLKKSAGKPRAAAADENADTRVMVRPETHRFSP